MVSKECCSKITGRDEISQTECSRASFEITAFEQSKLRILARPCDIYISERRAQGRGWAKFYMTRRNRTKVSSIHFQRELTLLSWRTSSARCISMHVRRGDLFKEALDLAETSSAHTRRHVLSLHRIDVSLSDRGNFVKFTLESFLTSQSSSFPPYCVPLILLFRHWFDLCFHDANILSLIYLAVM